MILAFFVILFSLAEVIKVEVLWKGMKTTEVL